ncbi:MAG: hypothetical protein P9X24_17510 [Candidatus Hatepunaea meridiana]|nr:hypothetical protein [Candidatus Hatepunaea meridiana]
MNENIERRLELPSSLPDGLDGFYKKLARLAALGMSSGFIMHEIRNNLAIISAQSQLVMIKSNTLTPDDLNKRMEQVIDQINQILSTLNQAGSFTSRAKGEVSDICPETALKNAISTLQRRCEDRGIRVVSELNVTDKVISYDASLFDYLLMQLLEVFIPVEKTVAKLHLSASGSDEYWEIEMILKARDDEYYYSNFINRATGFALSAALMVVEELKAELILLSGPEDYGFKLNIPW